MNKIHFYKSACLLACITAFSACNEQDEFESSAWNGNLLEIEAGIADTRTIITGSSFQKGDNINLFVLDEGGNDYTTGSFNNQAQYDGTTWKIQTDVRLNASKTPYVFAVYPSISGERVDINVNIPINVEPDYYDGIAGQVDYLYANVLPLKNKVAQLKFNHALARVTLALNRANGDLENGIITKVRLQNAEKFEATTNMPLGRGTELSTKGNLSLQNGVVKVEEDPEAYIELNTSLELSSETQYIDLLVIPTANQGETNWGTDGIIGGGVELEMTIDGTLYRIDLGYPTWYAEQQYVYPITVNRKEQEAILQPTQGEFIDLGLPSGILWASCNIGAKEPEKYGQYYAWGETISKDEYTLATYKYYDETSSSFTKIGNDISGSDYDAARANLSEYCQIPTREEFDELRKSCTWTWMTYNGTRGYFVVGPNGNSIFLPAAGDAEFNQGRSGYYWTANTGSSEFFATCFRFENGLYLTMDEMLFHGLPIRSVYTPQTINETAKAIDLGLSVKWANCNIGADSPEKFGNYYAWGETDTKQTYSWNTYKWANGTETSLIKYCANSSYGIVDNYTTIQALDDVARIKWGGTWRMPTQKEIQELVEKCTWVWTEENGITGYRITGNNGNSIFLPAAGYYDGTELKNLGSVGYYQSNTLSKYRSYYVHYLHVANDCKAWTYWCNRSYGLPVRPVTDELLSGSEK